MVISKIKFLFWMARSKKDRGMERTIKVIRVACCSSRNDLRIENIGIRIYR